jgi:chromosomal replication initiation ATPase DnaA
VSVVEVRVGDRVGQPRQLALALPHAESLSRDDFLEGPGNAAALALIDRWPDWPGRVVLLAGESGAGKSHLAAIWAARAGARLAAAGALTAAAVPGALATGAVAVEDLAPGDFDERALFHLLNLAREEGADVLLTARTAPASWRVALGDLRSRLRAIPVLTLAAPDDPLLRALIVKLCADRQMIVDDSLVSYLASRIERSAAAVREAVARLDTEALRRGRPVTRALAAELLRDAAA